MIPAITPFRQPPAWQRALQEAITEPAELIATLGLGEEWLAPAARAASQFRLRVPRGFVSDPVGDLAAIAGPGLHHKYEGRALFVTTGACAVSFRYCFRRHFPYAEESAVRGGFAPALAALAGELQSIPHLRRLRLHTRLPIIDATIIDALRRLRSTGTTVLNQSVLLRGVNDRCDTLADLSEALFAAGALPYYLHMLDPVAGAAHFDVPEPEARGLLAGIAARLPGYLVPRLAREVPGASAKTMVPPASR